MRDLFFCLGLLIAASSFGSDLKISHGSKNELILTSASCAQLLEQRAALCEWKQSLDSNFIAPPPAANLCRANNKGEFSISVADCLPELALKHAHKKLYHQGPNCWGTAMSFHGLSTQPRFLWPEEIHYWMDSPVCRMIGPGEKMLPGDVINVYYPENIWGAEMLKESPGTAFWESLYPNRYTRLPTAAIHSYSGYDGLLHSVTYISPEMAFGKDGPSETDRFYFHRLREVYGRPRDNALCQENPELIPYLRENQQSPKNDRHPGCPYFSVAYRCGNILDYFESQQLNEEDQLRLAHIRVLQNTQARLFKLVVGQTQTIPATAVKDLVKSSEETSGRALHLLAEKSRSKTSEMLLTLEYFSAAGVKKSLDQAGLIRH